MNQQEKKWLKQCENLFQKYRNTLPTSSPLKNPKLEYHALADGLFWSDEGILEVDWKLSNSFRIVINSRTKLITNTPERNELYKEVYNLALKYFPDWIGFKDERCRPDEVLAERVKRIRAVSEWKINKAFKDNVD